MSILSVEDKEHAKKILNIIFDMEKNPDNGRVECTIDKQFGINRYIGSDKYYNQKGKNINKFIENLVEYIHQHLDINKYSITKKNDSFGNIKWYIREYDRAYDNRNEKLVSNIRKRMLNNDFVALILEKIKANIDEKDEIIIGLDRIWWVPKNHVSFDNKKKIIFADYGYPSFDYFTQINVLADIINETLDNNYKCSYSTYNGEYHEITHACLIPIIRLTNSW